MFHPALCAAGLAIQVHAKEASMMSMRYVATLPGGFCAGNESCVRRSLTCPRTKYRAPFAFCSGSTLRALEGNADGGQQSAEYNNLLNKMKVSETSCTFGCERHALSTGCRLCFW